MCIKAKFNHRIRSLYIEIFKNCVWIYMGFLTWLAGCAQLHEFTVLFLLELPYSCTRTALRAPWPCMGCSIQNSTSTYRYRYLQAVPVTTGTGSRSSYSYRCTSSCNLCGQDARNYHWYANFASFLCEFPKWSIWAVMSFLLKPIHQKSPCRIYYRIFWVKISTVKQVPHALILKQAARGSAQRPNLVQL